MIQENISAPCTVLDFPTRQAFARELKAHHYDIVGVSSIIVNVGKAREMCRVVREVSPHSTIVVGGHVAAIPGIEHILDADHIVKGDGIEWMRRYLGEDVTAPIRHPALSSGFDLRVMGVKIPDRADASATIISSVGCPIGCNFCTTSAFFGGKGKMLNLYSTGEELFNLMEEAERSRQVKSFFIMDENFLLQRQRAMDLLARMKAAGKSWAFNIFSSANAIRKYSYEELVELGVSSIWLGLESSQSGYAKLAGTDTLRLTRELREQGIVLLGSTILGLEHRTPENISRGDRTRHRAPDRSPPVHALHRPCRARRSIARWRTRAGCSRMSTWPTSMAGTPSISGPGDLARRVPKVSRFGFPVGIRAQRPESLPRLPHHFEGWKRHKTIRTCACGSASGARPGCCGMFTAAYSGP